MIELELKYRSEVNEYILKSRSKVIEYIFISKNTPNRPKKSIDLNIMKKHVKNDKNDDESSVTKNFLAFSLDFSSRRTCDSLSERGH